MIENEPLGRKKPHPIPEGIPEHIIVKDTLDLHGFFPEQIPEMIEDFIRNALDLGFKEVKIIHGKGRSRLKYEVHKVLKNHPAVTDFHDAPIHSGGWGATHIRINQDT